MNFSKKQQAIIKDILSSTGTKRKRILGAAGTGKTLIIAHCSKELAKQGKKVLICYYNKTLQQRYIDLCFNGSHVRLDKFSGYDNINITNYHYFMYHLLNKYRRGELEYFRHEEYSDINPKNGYLLENYNGPIKYDYIFVDEMQDITPNAVSSLIALLELNGKICVFADKNQKLYESNSYESEDNTSNIVPKTPANKGFLGRWNRLDEIFRANNLIQALGDKYREKYLSSYGNEKYVLAGMRGDCEIIYKRDIRKREDLIYILKNELRYTNPKNISFLFFSNFQAQEFCDECSMNNVGYITTVDKGKDSFLISDDRIKVSTIKSFKGLDIDTVVLVLDDSGKTRTSNTKYEEIYVGLTRARKRLIIIDQMQNSDLSNIYDDPRNRNETVADEMQDEVLY